MSAVVTVDSSELEKLLRGMGAKADAVPLRSVAEIIASAVDEVFESEGQRGQSGQRWDPLKDTTIERHPRRRGRKVLQDSGQTAAVQQIVQGDSAGVRATTPYAGHHVTGTAFMAKRDFLDIHIGRTLDEIGELVLLEAEKG